jgi:hypothetical protein
MWFFGEEDEKNSVSGSRLAELSEGRSVGGLEGQLEVWKVSWRFGRSVGGLEGQLEVWKVSWRFGRSVGGFG